MPEQETRNLQCGRRRNTGSQNRPIAHLVVKQRRGPLTVEVLPDCPLFQANRATRRCSKSGHVDHVRTLGTFGSMEGPEYKKCLSRGGKSIPRTPRDIFMFAHRGLGVEAHR